MDNFIKISDGSEIFFGTTVDDEGRTIVRIGEYDILEADFQKKANQILSALNPCEEI